MSDTNMATVLEVLVKASERAAAIARACCEHASDESLVVTEKLGDEANARFDRDFKTIADVLAQECARHEIATRFPELVQHVRGEEGSELGGVRITVTDSPENTAALLELLVPAAAARRLAAAAHAEIALPCADTFPRDIHVDVNDIGVWIDPIDGTAEFIAGVRGEACEDGGLHCVTVLVGAYSRSSGEPLAGVVNQPFYNPESGRGVWGICVGLQRAWGSWGAGVLDDTQEAPRVVAVSGAGARDEGARAVWERLRGAGWRVVTMRGAGHKMLSVITGEAAASLVWGGGTFVWDTCAGHAVLRGQGGDAVVARGGGAITYSGGVQNQSGLVCYRDPKVYADLRLLLQ